MAGELRAALANAIANTRTHAGPGARSYVLLGDLGDEVVVSVRDDGVGIAPAASNKPGGRPDGVSKSIVGRIEALGGRATLESAPGRAQNGNGPSAVGSRTGKPQGRHVNGEGMW